MSDLTAAQVFGIGGGPSQWTSALSTYLDGRARLALESDNSVRMRQHAAALQAIASSVRSIAAGDAISILGNAVYQIAGRRAGTPYTPKSGGYAYRAFIHAGNVGGAVPWTDYVLAWFAGEIMDAHSRCAKVEADSHRARIERDAAVSTSQSATAARDREASARQQAEAEINTLVSQRDTLVQRVEFLRQQLAAVEPTADVEPAVTDEDERDFPTAEQLEEVLDKRRVTVAPGVAIERHQHAGVSDTWFAARIGNQVHWLGSATDGSMTISQAVAAKERLAAAKKEASK